MNKVPATIIYSNAECLGRILGLGYEIVHIDEWKHEPGHNYIALGDYCFTKISQTIPLGLRGAQHWLVCMMNRVGLNDDSNYIFAWDDPDSIQGAIEKLNNPNFLIPHPMYNPPEYEQINGIDEAERVLAELTQLPVGTWFGYDFESNHFPEEPDFILTGLGIATLERRIWIDFRDCMTEERPKLIDYADHPDEGLVRLNNAHRQFLEKHGHHCVVFNVRMELNSTKRYLGKFYEYRDLNVVNIMKQYGVWCNLKWTSRLICNINSWDDKFEEFNEALNKEIGGYWDDPVAEWNEDGTIKEVYWSKLKQRFNWISTSDLLEMKKRFDICNESFYFMPSRHLGYYCSLDAYNTLVSWLIELPKWNYVDSDHSEIGAKIDALPRFPIEDRFKAMSEAGIDIYCDGKIAEAIVNTGGQVLNSEWWNYCYDLNNRFQLHSITALSKYYCTKMMELCKDRNNLEDYTPLAAKLIANGVDVTMGGFYLSKYLFSERYFDENCEGQCNTNLIYEDWGQEIGDEILGWLWDYTDTLYGINRKRSVHLTIGEIIDRELKMSDELLAKHESTITYYQYKDKLDWYNNLPWSNTPVNEIKNEYELGGEVKNIHDWIDFLSCNININTLQGEILGYVLDDYNDLRIFMITMADGYDWELYDHYKRESLEGDMNYFYSDDAMNYLGQDAVDFIISTSKNDKWDSKYQWMYSHFQLIHQVKVNYPNEFDEIMSNVRNGKMTEKYKMFEVMIYLRMFAKYFKIKTYFEGLYYENNINYHTLDDYWMPDNFPYEEYDHNHNVLARPVFQANIQFSGRWSSNFHTIPSRNELKRCTDSPEDSVFTYFDISAMEVRTIGYLARDSKIMELYESGVDLYKFCAKFMLGEEYWNNLDPEYQGEYRNDFKVVLLAYFYLRGARSLAPELGKSVEETQAIMDSLAKTFPEGIEFRDYMSRYPVEHDGRLLTPFGEWIASYEEEYRQIKHGINTPIQGASAVMLVYGFYNLMKQSWNKGWKFRSVGYVHDSSQSYFDINHLWEMRDHYYDCVTQFLWDRFRVRYEFDIMCGTNYYDVCKLSQVDPNNIKLKGTGVSINNLIKRLRKNNIAFEVISDKLNSEGLLNEDRQDPLTAFVNTGAYEAQFLPDNSKYEVILKKL